MSARDDLLRNYRVAFLRYRSTGAEAPLHTGYEIGRSALGQGLSVLELAQVHHQVFLEALRETADDELDRLGAVASEFFLEALATYDMAQRGVTDRR